MNATCTRWDKVVLCMYVHLSCIHIYDMLGSEVDRIEMKINVSTFIDVVSCISFFQQKDNPEVRHVDLEIFVVIY